MSAPVSEATDQLIDNAATLEAIAATPYDHEKRIQHRHPYPAKVTVALLSHEGKLGSPSVVQAVDISQGGICIESRQMFHPGFEGVMQLTRSDGTRSLVGVRVCHCRYLGNMMHQTGLQFVPIPDAVARTMRKG